MRSSGPKQGGVFSRGRILPAPLGAAERGRSAATFLPASQHPNSLRRGAGLGALCRNRQDILDDGIHGQLPGAM